MTFSWMLGSPRFHKAGFPGGSVVKNPPASVGGTGLILGLERCPEEGNGNPLQYSCLGNPMDRGTWQLTVHVIARVGHDSATNAIAEECTNLTRTMRSQE